MLNSCFIHTWPLCFVCAMSKPIPMSLSEISFFFTSSATGWSEKRSYMKEKAVCLFLGHKTHHGHPKYLTKILLKTWSKLLGNHQQSKMLWWLPTTGSNFDESPLLKDSNRYDRFYLKQHYEHEMMVQTWC